MHASFRLLFIAVLFAATACRDRETIDLQTDKGHNYLPLEIGKSTTWQVDSIVFDTDGQGGFFIDTVRFQLKEIIADTFRNAAGELAFRLERFRRADAAHPWEPTAVWWTQRIDNQTIRVENNHRFISLIHPMDRRSEWNGLAFIDPFQLIEIAGEPLDLFKGWQFEVDSIDVRSTIGGIQFDSVLVITQANYDDKVDLRFSRQKFVRGVGLAYFEQKLLHSKCADDGDLVPCLGKPWEEIAGKGFILRQTILE